MGDERTYSRAELEEVAGLAAGAAAGVFMRAMPEFVMPSEEISEAVGCALADFDERRATPLGPVRAGEEFPSVDGPGRQWPTTRAEQKRQDAREAAERRRALGLPTAELTDG